MAEPGEGLTLAKVTKRFGATRALVDAHLQIRAGRGAHAARRKRLRQVDARQDHRRGAPAQTRESSALTRVSVERRGPRGMSELGIAVVFQEVLTAASQSVLNNIWLGSDGLFTRKLNTVEATADRR